MHKISSHIHKFTIGLMLFGIVSLPLSGQSTEQLKLTQKADKKLENWNSCFGEWKHLGEISIDSVSVLSQQLLVQLFFNKTLSYIPVREENYRDAVRSLTEQLGRRFRKYDIQLYTDGQLFQNLIPNYFRIELAVDSSRLSRENRRPVPLIREIGEFKPEYGLYNRNIALWPSHGYYYESKLDRWEWQRARLHTTVEDIFPMTFVLPYIVPMLENAGATIFLPRERDIQTREVIVDNDAAIENSKIIIYGVKPDTISGNGFVWKDTLRSGENPFAMGSHLRFSTTNSDSSFLKYVPEIPKDGDYAVYISYAQSEMNVSDVKYSVYHAGGKTEFLLNQQMGGGTWIYLGTFYFVKGINQDIGCVIVSTESKESGWITSDAIKFGGGMGNVARRPSEELMPNQKTNPNDFRWKISNKPRYMEAARYWLQYDGMPDTLVYNLNSGKNDYNDDYQSRGEWVNYLMGNPNGPTGHREVTGLKIPMDLSFAFHTDAGVTANDSIIGTLSIYSSLRNKGIFPDGQSKMASRDLSDIIQSEIVNDIRKLYNPKWTRRGLWNKEYSEAWRANVPTMLLELMSHQNLADMYFGLDPRFRFAVSRSIYKGILKFLAYQEERNYVVQPLPVDYFSISHISDKTIRLSWRPVMDPLEPTAEPEKYMLYQRVGELGFDNGIVVEDSSVVITLNNYNQLYSFKVSAVNSGGESFPGEILSAGFVEGSDKIALVVNGFDRVCGAAIIDSKEIAGISSWKDRGVPYKYEIGYTGSPYDFDRKSPWLDDDSPGWGASYGDVEGKILPGNSFDFPFIHGEAILATGYSFVSVSDEVFSNDSFNPEPFNFVDIIYGEEKSTSDLKDNSIIKYKVFAPAARKKIKQYTESGGNLFISGAYIASDFILNDDTLAKKFAENVLHYSWRTNHAVKSGEVIATDYARYIFSGQWEFNTSYNPDIYTVEAPDAIEPFGEGAITAFRYLENNSSAGVCYKGEYKTVVLGFPFETIIKKDQRFDFMKQVVGFFEKDN
ncbi:MAG: xanthan lyase [Bacteroidales bacterium]|nr:xanthan lyase [Bacteroidales bacterium]